MTYRTEGHRWWDRVTERKKERGGKSADNMKCNQRERDCGGDEIVN